MSRYLLNDNRRVDGSSLIDINATNTRQCDTLSTAEKTALNVRQITEVIPSFDPTTEVMLAPTVSPDGLTETYTKRAKTAQELDADKDFMINSLGMQNLLRVILNLHNRIRVLEGQPTNTLAQLKIALRALL